MTKSPPMNAPCLCHSHKIFEQCCAPFLEGQSLPSTPEALMRSRYSAFATANIAYIQATMCGEALKGFNEAHTRGFAQQNCWVKLEVLDTSFDTDTIGYVEFKAYYVRGSTLRCLHEHSKFMLKNNHWYYVSGTHTQDTDMKMVIARNTACPCGSQRKFKNCHAKN